MTSTTGPNSGVFALTRGKKYDPDGVYTQSTDGKGHYEQARVKIPPQIEHLIAEVCAANPAFKSSQDFMRNAVFHSLHKYLTSTPDLDPRLMAALEAERLANLFDMEQRIYTSHQQTMDSARASLNNSMESGDWNNMSEIADAMDACAENSAIPFGLQSEYQEVADDARRAMRTELKIRRKRK
jgi:hypothetical protein